MNNNYDDNSSYNEPNKYYIGNIARNSRLISVLRKAGMFGPAIVSLAVLYSH